MNIQDILTAIASVGFPIVACCGLAYFMIKEIRANRDEIREIQKDHKEEVKGMTEAINNNTLVMQKLIDKIGE